MLYYLKHPPRCLQRFYNNHHYGTPSKCPINAEQRKVAEKRMGQNVIRLIHINIFFLMSKNISNRTSLPYSFTLLSKHSLNHLSDRSSLLWSTILLLCPSAISAITTAGSVHKSRGDNVLRMWVQLKR